MHTAFLAGAIRQLIPIYWSLWLLLRMLTFKSPTFYKNILWPGLATALPLVAYWIATVWSAHAAGPGPTGVYP
jgi:hypothetical protein